MSVVRAPDSANVRRRPNIVSAPPKSLRRVAMQQKAHNQPHHEYHQVPRAVNCSCQINHSMNAGRRNTSTSDNHRFRGGFTAASPDIVRNGFQRKVVGRRAVCDFAWRHRSKQRQSSRTRSLYKPNTMISPRRADQRIIDSRWPAKRGNCPIFGASVLAEAVLFLHLLWCAWVFLGWTVTRCRRVLRTLHVAHLSTPSSSSWFPGPRARSPWPNVA